MVGLAPIPAVPSYSISKAAAFNMSQSLRALLASDGVTVHTVVLGPIDTEMSRGLEVPKASPESALSGIFDGLENCEDEILPRPSGSVYRPRLARGQGARAAIRRIRAAACNCVTLFISAHKETRFRKQRRHKMATSKERDMEQPKGNLPKNTP